MKLVTVALVVLALGAAQSSALKIAVISGEDAVNVIQQKTAVAPVIEVRDRNNVPVAGAVVTFSIEGGKAAAFTGGANTMTITTNAAGRAVAAGLDPLGSGSFQINVQAAFQGQTATASIAQTNVLTAAQAAPGAAAAGGTGGGLSATTIAVVGAAVAGGAVAATQLTGGDDSGGDQQGTTYRGTFSTPLSVQFNNSSNNSSCTLDHAISATLEFLLQQRADGSVSGTVEAHGTDTVVGGTCGGASGGAGAFTIKSTPVSGTAGSLSFSTATTETTPNAGSSGSQTTNNTSSFSGSLIGSVITGTLILESTGTLTSPGVNSAFSGRASVAITATK